MLQIQIKAGEGYNDDTETFTSLPAVSLELEHSLISLSKWESIHMVPFLGKDEKSPEDILDYIRCMSIKKVDPEVFDRLKIEDFKKINEYIAAPMTATTFRKQESKPLAETITSELIYYWMFALNIPMECEKWHINRLLTLIRVCNIKNTPPKKTSKAALARQRSELNEQRRAQYGTAG